MENLEDILSDMNHDKMLSDCDDAVLNQYIITGIQSGINNNVVNRRIGRIVQVRTHGNESIGDATVLLRHLDGGLTSHSNQFYVPLMGNNLSRVRAAFEELDVCMDDPHGQPYSICGEDSVKGFIVTPEDIEVQKIIDGRDVKIEKIISEGES